MEAFAKAPPTNEFNKPSIPPDVDACKLDSLLGSIPGRTI
jgi:hypothetical protein